MFNNLCGHWRGIFLNLDLAIQHIEIVSLNYQRSRQDEADLNRNNNEVMAQGSHRKFIVTVHQVPYLAVFPAAVWTRVSFNRLLNFVFAGHTWDLLFIPLFTKVNGCVGVENTYVVKKIKYGICDLEIDKNNPEISESVAIMDTRKRNSWDPEHWNDGFWPCWGRNTDVKWETRAISCVRMEWGSVQANAMVLCQGPDGEGVQQVPDAAKRLV